MLISDGPGRSQGLDLGLAATLSAVAGGVNSVGFVVSGFFSANMTGNVTMISDLLTERQWQAALGFALVVSMFVLGAFAASLASEWGRQHGLSRIYALILFVEAALLFMTGSYAAISGNADGRALVAVLAVSMGIQNASSTRLSSGRVRTTHVSGLSTDLGAGLAVLVYTTPPEMKAEQALIKQRLVLYAATIASFLIGGAAGVVGYRVINAWILCLLAMPIALLCARYGLTSSPRQDG